MSEKDARVAVCKVGEGPLRVLFVCHGNICRSTMAQFVFEDLVRRAGRKQDFVVDSAATSREEIGNAPHHGTVARLRRAGVPVGRHHARQVRRGEYADWDVIAYTWTMRTSGACGASSVRTLPGACSTRRKRS